MLIKDFKQQIRTNAEQSRKLANVKFINDSCKLGLRDSLEFVNKYFNYSNVVVSTKTMTRALNELKAKDCYKHIKKYKI